MSPTGEGRRLLPLLTNRSTGRQEVTCKYRCGNACSHEAPNISDNEYFGDVLRKVQTRRGVLRTGAVVGMAAGGTALFGGTAAARPNGPGSNGKAKARKVPGTDFQPVEPNTKDAVTVPKGYEQDVVIRWGDPILPSAPKFNFDRQTPQAQAGQFGFNNDFCGLVPLPGEKDTWLMVNNFEYTSEPFMFKGYDPEKGASEKQAKIAWASHGMGVVRVERDGDRGLKYKVDPVYNRRFTLDSTAFSVRGPARGSTYLRTSADPKGTTIIGTQNNCAGGITPWGTILSGEENFNQYFANADKITGPTTKKRLARYGIAGEASERRWENYDDRFDVKKEPNEVNRFGWIVEVDPLEPNAAPVKHTALGRLKHEGANIIIAEDGRAVAYMGDDERFEYVYKFVSDKKFKPGKGKKAREHNKKLLEKGTLYVAKFHGDSPKEEIDGTGKLPSDGEFDGTGEWIKLAHNDESFVDGFTAEQVYVFTRLAGDKVGATKMDRPEDVEPSLKTRRMYAALTNNTDRGASGKEGATEPNPRVGNKHGQVLELEEWGSDNTATTFSWKLLLVCGDPEDPNTYFGGYDKSDVSPISCPDNLAFDRYGNLWISTDGNALESNDGLFAVPLTGEERGHVKQFLTVPVGAETCGPVITDEFVLVSVQHPGELDDASADNPASHWPDGGNSQPRPSVVAVWRAGGGQIGR